MVNDTIKESRVHNISTDIMNSESICNTKALIPLPLSLFDTTNPKFLNLGGYGLMVNNIHAR